MQSEKCARKARNKNTKKTQKTKKKQLAQHKNQFQLKKFSKHLARWYLKGTCQNFTPKTYEQLRKKGSKQHARNQPKIDKKTILLLCFFLFCPPLFGYIFCIFACFLVYFVRTTSDVLSVFLMFFCTSGQLFWHTFVACFRAPADL